MAEKSFWTKVSKGVQLPNEPVLVEGFFSKKGNYTSGKRFFRVYNSQIFYFDEKHNDQPKGYCHIDFDLHFEIVRSKEKKEGQALGSPKGIILDRANQKTELSTNDESLIIKWRDVLRERINQRGFHEQYKAIKKIGKGCFASVYLAERLEDGKSFAVKAFAKEAAYSQENGKEALINEIELMRALNHPNIIRLHEVYETENSLYLILDLLEGGQLYDKLKAKQKFTIDQTRSMVKGLLEGLAEMHANNIMHRDLKPENLIFKNSHSLDLIIADLGLGTKTDVPKFMFVRCGTPGFVAPEVINIMDFDLKYDSVCDIFSLGLIFHILLIGKSPFNGKTYEEILAQNRASNITFEGAEYLKLPLQAYDLLKKMLLNDPKQRITAKKALQHPFFAEAPKQMTEEELNNLPESERMKKLEELNRNRLKSITSNSPMPSPQILPTKGKKITADEQGAFKMPNTPILTGRTDEIAHDGGFNSPSIQIEQRQIKQMGGNFVANVKSPSMFSPKVQFGAKNIQKMPQQTQEKDEEEKKNNDNPDQQKQAQQVLNKIKNFGI